MTPLLPCNFAVLRFRPYRETGEFVNIGVVLACPAARFFDFQVETQRTRRITGFFPELDRAAFRLARQHFREELVRVRTLLKHAGEKTTEAERAGVFRELVRPREAVLRFGEAGTALVEDPAAKLKELFECHVNRQFAQNREYQEKVMALRLMKVLRAHELVGHYRQNKQVGNEEFHVLMPIVSEARNAQGVARRAIKPLDLDRAEPTKIYDHGDAWIRRVERLRQVNQLPEGMLFTIREATGNEKRIKACREICDELRRKDVRVLTMDDESHVLEFAKIEAN